MYALKLADDGRILHVTHESFVVNVETEKGVVDILDGYIIVSNIPEGDVYEYRYENGNFVHDPEIVIPEEPKPGELSLSERVSALEKAAPAPAEFVPGTWYYRGDKVKFEGCTYSCIAPSGVTCVWSPSEYPAYWRKDV